MFHWFIQFINLLQSNNIVRLIIGVSEEMIERKKIFKYIKEKYNINPEYLWKDTPDAAIFRHHNNRKWFALIMNVKGEEYINVKTEPDYSDLLRNTYDYIIPAYHMNKEHWNTIIISKDVNQTLLYEMIDQSYELTKK